MFRFVSIVVALLFGSVLSADETTASQAERIGQRIRQRWPHEEPIDETMLREAGIRRIDGRHLTLYTDLPPKPEIDELPALFDRMIPLLCDYFELDRRHYETFRVEGFLIDDFDKFKPSGAVRQVPDLRAGYALRLRVWLRNQRSDYYRRHLLLHEGVHAFMGYAFGFWGPPWYREGTAELLALHRWSDGNLTIARFPASRDEVSLWGRIEYIQKDLREGRRRSLEDVFRLAAEDYDENQAYAWSWAFAVFCEKHSKYRTPFRRTAWRLTGRPAEVEERFLRLVREEFPAKTETEVRRILESDWIDFLENICYGYDFERTEIDYGGSVAAVLKGEPETVRVRADRGWQNAGFRLEKGKTYRLTASGRFQLAQTPKIWWSEPNGVTIRYHRGIPIGTLLGILLPDDAPPDPSPTVVGRETLWSPDVSGTLFLRVNDFASQLEDNRGEVDVRLLEETAIPRQ